MLCHTCAPSWSLFPECCRRRPCSAPRLGTASGTARAAECGWVVRQAQATVSQLHTICSHYRAVHCLAWCSTRFEAAVRHMRCLPTTTAAVETKLALPGAHPSHDAALQILRIQPLLPQFLSVAAAAVAHLLREGEQSSLTNLCWAGRAPARDGAYATATGAASNNWSHTAHQPAMSDSRYLAVRTVQ